tara:strand:+ start:1513 stop:2940 length:1428 start_codon:yes stop_codon:yes gene_type:complete
MEKVDYTTRIPTNRRNIEAANRMVHADYTPRNVYERKIRPYVEGIKKFDRERTGIAQFAGNVKDFYSARNKYSRDKGLGKFEETYKNPYSKDQLRWLGNMGYNVGEFVGDIFKTGAQALGTAATGIDFIPGDEGIGGEWAKMQGYNPKWETALGNISNPWYDDLKAGEFEMAQGEAERSSGASLLNEKDFLTALGNTNFQNHLRNYGLDLEGVKKEDMVPTLEKFYVDKFYDQFSEELGTVDVGGKKYNVPKEWKDRYEGYTDDELAQAFDKDMATFSNKEWGQISTDYKEGAQKKYTDTLMDKFDFNEDELAYAMSKGETPLHMGLWEDFAHENTMPFVGELGDYEGFKAAPDGEMIYESYPNQILPYETDEAKELSKSGWSSLPEWAAYGPAFGAVRRGSGILSKATEGTKAGALNKIYQNIYPGLSGSGGPIPGFNFPSRAFTGRDWLLPGRSMWQFPAATYAASLRETGGE